MNRIQAVALLALFAGMIAPICSQAQENLKPALAHTRNEFNFTAHAPYERVFPLFGALEEKKWAEGWDPQFVYPSPARDQQGMVFTVERAGMTSVWTNAALDEAAGHVQYVYILNDAMVTLVDIHLAKAGATETRVSVVYERTALKPEANEHVTHYAKGDAKSGPGWEQAINGYLAKARTAPPSSK
jgi:hypothetical protein